MFSGITQDGELHKDHRGRRRRREKKHFTCQCCQGQNQEPAAQRHLFTIGAAREWDTKQQRDVYAACVGPSVCCWRDLVCVWVSACKSRSVLSRSVYLSSPPFAISFTISSQGRAQRSSENQYSVGFCSLNWDDPCFMCPDVSNWDINKRVNKIDVEISTVYILYNVSKHNQQGNGWKDEKTTRYFSEIHSLSHMYVKKNIKFYRIVIFQFHVSSTCRKNLNKSSCFFLQDDMW